MPKIKVILDYDTESQWLSRKEEFITVWDFGEYLNDIKCDTNADTKETVTSNKLSEVKELLSSGVSIDDIIKLKNSGVL